MYKQRVVVDDACGGDSRTLQFAHMGFKIVKQEMTKVNLKETNCFLCNQW